MNKRELSQIFYTDKEIRMWELELARVREESEIKGQEITDMPKGSGGISDKTGERAAKIVDLETIIKGELKKVKIQRKAIINYIKSIDDSLMRQIMFYRHIELMKWDKIAKKIGGGNKEDTIRKAHDRFIK